MTLTQKKKRVLIYTLCAAGLPLLVAIVLVPSTRQWHEAGFTMLNGVEDMVVWLRALGPWAVAGSIALMVIHSFLPFPAELLTLANGMVFGPFWGTVITWTGAMLGATSTFALVRLVGRPFVERMLSERQLVRLSAWSSTQGGITLLVARFIPLIAFNLLNYAAAMTNISWWTFIWATGLGILPLTILLNVFGASVLSMSSWVWLPLGVVVLLGWLLIRRR